MASLETVPVAGSRAGRYLFLRQLTSSFVGALWESRCEAEQQLLALTRVVKLPPGVDPEVEQTLAQAAWDSMELDDDSLVRIADVVFGTGWFALVHDHHDGETLRTVQKRITERKSGIPVPVAVRIVLDAVEAVRKTNEAIEDLGVSYRSPTVDPGSFLVCDDGRTRLLDGFVGDVIPGVPKMAKDSDTLAYAAPELFEAEPKVDERTLVFRLAVLAWELLTSKRLLVGSKPVILRRLQSPIIRADRVVRVGAKAPEALGRAIEQALQPNPGARQWSLKAFEEALRETAGKVGTQEDVVQFMDALAGRESTLARLVMEKPKRLSDAIKKPRATAELAKAGKPTSPAKRSSQTQNTKTKTKTQTQTQTKTAVATEKPQPVPRPIRKPTTRGMPRVGTAPDTVFHALPRVPVPPLQPPDPSARTAPPPVPSAITAAAKAAASSSLTRTGNHPVYRPGTPALKDSKPSKVGTFPKAPAGGMANRSLGTGVGMASAAAAKLEAVPPPLPIVPAPEPESAATLMQFPAVNQPAQPAAPSLGAESAAPTQTTPAKDELPAPRKRLKTLMGISDELAEELRQHTAAEAAVETPHADAIPAQTIERDTTPEDDTAPIVPSSSVAIQDPFEDESSEDASPEGDDELDDVPTQAYHIGQLSNLAHEARPDEDPRESGLCLTTRPPAAEDPSPAVNAPPPPLPRGLDDFDTDPTMPAMQDGVSGIHPNYTHANLPAPQAHSGTGQATAPGVSQSAAPQRGDRRLMALALFFAATSLTLGVLALGLFARSHSAEQSANALAAAPLVNTRAATLAPTAQPPPPQVSPPPKPVQASDDSDSQNDEAKDDEAKDDEANSETSDDEQAKAEAAEQEQAKQEQAKAEAEKSAPPPPVKPVVKRPVPRRAVRRAPPPRKPSQNRYVPSDI